MPDEAQLPHLLKLLDDETPTVHDAVIKELIAFGPGLEEALLSLSEPISSEQWEILKDLIAVHNRNWLKEAWPKWFDIDNEYEKLETALALLADFQNSRIYPLKMSELLDQLAADFQQQPIEKDALQLAHFLFKDKQFKGARNDYNNPQNSNLVYVIENKEGIPISLAVIYMLVGHRVGLHVEGCNFPAHFLAKVFLTDEMVLVDCFNNGRIIKEEVLTANTDLTSTVRGIIRNYTDSTTIITRVIRNLIRAYYQREDFETSKLMLDLVKDIQRHRSEELSQAAGEGSEDIPQPLFKPGQLVYHKRYGYRGVVVDYDFICQANEIWYQSNQTQPDREQPWYHVLVHKSQYNTYVAQNNLIPDNTREKIHHPLLNYFFSDFIDGHYLRNNHPWTL